MNEINENQIYKPHKYQKEFHKSKKRFRIVVAHRRFGKTVMVLREIIKKALECKLPSPRYAYVAPTYRMAKVIAWDYLKQFTSDMKKVKYHASELRVDFGFNNARIQLLSAHEPDRLRGLYLDGVILDEYAMMRSDFFSKIIRPMLSDRKGWAVFIGTPLGKNHFYKLFEESEKLKNWYRGFYPVNKTGRISNQELEDIKKIMTPEEYAQEYECAWEISLPGTFYGELIKKMEDENRVREGVYLIDRPVNTYWDLGYSDDTAIIFAQEDKGKILVVDSMADRGYPLPYYIKKLREKPYKYGRHFAPHDIRKTDFTNGKSAMDIASEYNFDFEITPRVGVIDGINAARLTLEDCIFEKNKTEDLVESLRQYRRKYDPETKAFSQNPLHDWTSHYADAFRYLAVCKGGNIDGEKSKPLDEEKYRSEYYRYLNLEK